MLLVAQHMAQYAITGNEAPPMPTRLPAWPIYDIFDVADGQVFVGVVTDTQWNVFCEAFGLAQLAADPTLSNQRARVAGRERTLPVVAAAFAAFTRQALMDKMKEYQEIEGKKRTAVQNMVANLAVNFLDYEMLVTHFDFIAKPFGTNLKSVPAEILKGNEGPPLRLSKVLPSLMDYLAKHPESAAPMQNPWLMDAVRGALGGMMSGNQELSLRLFPPPVGVMEAWHGPGWIIIGAVQGKAPSAADLAWLASYEDLYLNAGDPAKFKASVHALADHIKAAAAARGEGQYVNLEEHYLQADYFYYALIFFFLGFILLAITWGFFKVFSEMNSDPILRRIVREDDRKEQGNFYFKFGEALALPLLAMGSTILPGGTGRILSLVQALVSHAQ